MGSFDGAEICDLMGLYCLHILGKMYGKHRIGLNRGDVLSCFEYTSKSQVGRIKEDFMKIFMEILIQGSFAKQT